LEARAIEKYLRISPRKVKHVIDIVKNKQVEDALGILMLTPKKAASYVRKAIQSAAANAVENFKEYKVSEDDLYIKEIFVTEGPTLKRFKPRARGRADRELKRTSHITVFVWDKKNNISVKDSVKEVKEKVPATGKEPVKVSTKSPAKAKEPKKTVKAVTEGTKTIKKATTQKKKEAKS
jgi:large subunit ribosomal protein L22